MRVHVSAQRHGVGPDDDVEAAEHPVFLSDLDGDRPARQLRLPRRLLEVVVLRFDSGNELLIPAMTARRQYLDLLD